MFSRKRGRRSLRIKEVNMGLFKKKQRPTTTELKCPAEGCPFTCDSPVLMKRHTGWKHPELTKTAGK